jgi:hypothetical protein
MWLWVWLALIVQIVAPVLAGTSMVAAAADPLATSWICGRDGPPNGTPDHPRGTDEACRLCDIVCKPGGMAPAVEATSFPFVTLVGHAVAWDEARLDLVAQGGLERARARAPPAAA